MTMMMIVEHMIYDMNMIVVFTNPGHLIVADILDLACERDIASNPGDVIMLKESTMAILGKKVS